MKVVIDLQKTYFIHAILMVDDVTDGFAWSENDSGVTKDFLQNVQIYIGDDSEIASNNEICLGGPFLDVNDPNSSSSDPNTFNSNGY